MSLTKDTRIFTFQLPKDRSMLVPIGYHIHLKAHLPSSQQLLRSYTPVNSVIGDSLLLDESLIPLIIKIYPKGPMSSFLDQCPPGNSAQFLLHIIHGRFTLASKERRLISAGLKGHSTFQIFLRQATFC